MKDTTITLTEHLNHVEPDLREVILLCSSLAAPIRRAFRSERGMAGTKNVFGEDQLALDTWADRFIIDRLGECPLIRCVASEERPELVRFDHPDGVFSVTLDPMDGSSLIDVNLTIGTIIGIYRADDPLRPGRTLAAAMYILYGPMTTFVYSAGQGGVHEFVETRDGIFTLFNGDIRIPRGQIMGPGGLRKNYLPHHEAFMRHLEDRGFKIRFSGSFVADVHQVLHKGGIFTYPAMTTHPEGKLRLLFEANPMGFLVTRAGGRISTGYANILDMEPRGLDQRVPIYIGDTEAVDLIESCARGE